MTAVFTSNLAQWEAEHARAIDRAGTDAAEVYQAAVQERLRLGYMGGMDTTGAAAENVIVADPVTEHGVRVFRIGTGWERALQWEVGYVDELTKEFRRVPIWRPIANQTAAQIAARFVGTYRAEMAKWRAA